MKRPDKKKLIPVVAIALVLLGLLIWRHMKPFYYAGVVEAVEVDLSARVQSAIAEFPVDEGQSVSAGQLLVRLSCEDISLAAELAEKDFQRGVQLFKTGSLPQEAFDKMKNRRDDAKVRSDWCSIKAPQDGTILSRYREPGELVSPGTKLLTLADLSRVEAVIYVPQPLLAKLSLGQKIEAILPELSEKKFSGKIIHIREKAEFTPKNVQTRDERTRLVFGVKLSFENPDRILKPGMTVEVRLD